MRSQNGEYAVTFSPMAIVFSLPLILLGSAFRPSSGPGTVTVTVKVAVALTETLAEHVAATATVTELQDS